MRDEAGASKGAEGADDRLHYIAQMSGELARMAEESRLSLLAYLLGMAKDEATSALRDGVGEASDRRS
jgi:hypothetical protein